jgi:hypothetical protein
MVSHSAAGGVFETLPANALGEPAPASLPYAEPPPDAFAQAAANALLNPDPAFEQEIAESAFKENDPEPMTVVNDRGEVIGEVAPNPRIPGGIYARVIERKLLERPDDIREAARNLSDAFRNQAHELRKSKPNEPGQLAQYENLLSFFEQMAAGLADLADALDRAFSTATTLLHRQNRFCSERPLKSLTDFNV